MWGSVDQFLRYVGLKDFRGPLISPLIWDMEGPQFICRCISMSPTNVQNFTVLSLIGVPGSHQIFDFLEDGRILVIIWGNLTNRFSYQVAYPQALQMENVLSSFFAISLLKSR